jgi:hypothetical protein
MTLKEVSDCIKSASEKTNIYAIQFPEGFKNPQISVLKKIENYENYTVIRLLFYMEFLGLILYLNDEEIPDIQKLGQVLSSLRKKMNYSQFEMRVKTGLSPGRICTIEQGRSYTKKTLEKYISVLPVDFTVKNINK